MQPSGQVMNTSLSALTQMIKTQQASLAVKLNGLSNYNQDTKMQPAGVLLCLINPPALALAQPMQPRHPEGQAQGAGAGVTTGTAHDSWLPRTGGCQQGRHCSAKPFSSLGSG